MAAGPALAGLVAGVTGADGAGLEGLTCQEILGVVAAGARLAAWAGWVQAVALAGFARRRAVLSGTRAGREAAEECAWKTGETWSRMQAQLGWAVTVTGRLPRTLEAMRDGQLPEYKARIIEAQTAGLSGADAAGADVILAGAGQVKNPAALRDFARRQVTRIGPEAAGRSKERARQDAYVRIYQEDSGNAGLPARQMPAADAVLAWADIERRALDLHAAGTAGTAGQLQVRAVLDFLLGRAVPGQDAHQDAGEGACPGTHADTGEGACQDAHRDQGEDAHRDQEEDGCLDACWDDDEDSAYQDARDGAGAGPG